MSDVFVNIGDTVHIAAPVDDMAVDPIAAKPVIVAPSVAELLAISRAAHQRFQKASGHNDGRRVTSPDYSAAALAVQQALDARAAAEQADHDRLDPAWADDLDAMRVPSETLTSFYRDYMSTP